MIKIDYYRLFFHNFKNNIYGLEILNEYVFSTTLLYKNSKDVFQFFTI